MPVTFTDKQIREHFYTNGNDDVCWSYIEDTNFLDIDEGLGKQIYNILIFINESIIVFKIITRLIFLTCLLIEQLLLLA